MSGKYLLDTNAFLQLTSSLSLLNAIKEGTEFFISVISELELLSFGKITSEEELLIKNLMKRTSIFDLDEKIKNKSIEIRRKYKIKLPDAIIDATSITNSLPIITYDKTFSKIEELKILTIEELPSE